MPISAKVRSVLFTVSNEMLGNSFRMVWNILTAEGWSFDLVNSLKMAIRCGVTLRLCRLHFSMKEERALVSFLSCMPLRCRRGSDALGIYAPILAFADLGHEVSQPEAGDGASVFCPEVTK